MKKEIKNIEDARAFWANVAKENDWYNEPFFVQVWLNEDGTIRDSVSFKTLTNDIVLQTSIVPLCSPCAYDLDLTDGNGADCVKTATLEDGEGIPYCYNCEGTIDDDWAYVTETDILVHPIN